jgi:lysyl-tRNA synthetase class 2
MPSTVIRRHAYDPSRGELTIEFVTGRVYVYSNVPPEAVEAFRAAFSKGRHFNRHIREQYPARELTDRLGDHFDPDRATHRVGDEAFFVRDVV